jgi:hypothetical protein
LTGIAVSLIYPLGIPLGAGVAQCRIPADATPVERIAMKLKTKKDRAVYARRNAIVEPLFRQINTRHGNHVLLRGLQKASGRGS